MVSQAATVKQLMQSIPADPIPIMRRILAEKSLKQFIQQAWPIVEQKKKLIWNWHLDVICQHLEVVTNTYVIGSGLRNRTVGDYTYTADLTLPPINYLWINMPPRHMKSLIVSVFWPCWEWGPKNLTETRYLCLSYAQPLSTRDSLKRRRIIESKWYQENWGNRFYLVSDQNAKTRYDNDKTGYMIATSILGIGTGEGGSRVIIDDAHNVNEVESDVKRQRTIDAWDDALSTRVDDDTIGAYIGVMQRTHHKDLTGHLIEKYRRKEIEQFTHLCLPARYEKDHPFPTISPLPFKDPRTVEGEPLDRNRWPEEKLRIREGRMTAWAKAGQLQQRPAPKGGSIVQVGNIKVVKNYNHRQVLQMVRYWDKAASEDKSASNTATVLLARMTDDCEYAVLVLDAFQGQWNVGYRDKRMRQTAEMDGIEVEQVVEQEPGSGGKESAQSSVRKIFLGFKAAMDRPTGAKEVRIEPFASQVENDNVAMLEGPWNKEYLESLENSTPGSVGDLADATSGAFNWVFGLAGKRKSKIRVSFGKDKLDDDIQ